MNAIENRIQLLETVTDCVELLGCGYFDPVEHFSPNNSEIPFELNESFVRFLRKTRIERNVPTVVFGTSKLLQDVTDEYNYNSGKNGIISELGRNYKLNLWHLWSLLLKQPNGGSGLLKESHRPNLLYVDKTESVISVFRNGGVWNIGEYSIKEKDGWKSSSLIIHRKDGE